MQTKLQGGLAGQPMPPPELCVAVLQGLVSNQAVAASLKQDIMVWMQNFSREWFTWVSQYCASRISSPNPSPSVQRDYLRYLPLYCHVLARFSIACVPS